MRYLGGKSRLAKRIAAPINEVLNGRPLWEPFCGGLGMSAAWDHPEYLLLTDACPPLIHMYQAFDVDWDPPTHPISREEFDWAMTLPDENPLKGFLGFGVAFAGEWGRYAAQPDLSLQSCRSLARTFMQLGPHGFALQDFCAVEPYPLNAVIYCDPPYVGTHGYRAAPPFDHEVFYDRVVQWAQMGADVFISEYHVPEDVGTLILEFERTLRGRSHDDGRARPMVTEKLYWVEP